MDATADQLANLKRATEAIEVAQRSLTLALHAAELLRSDLRFRLDTGVERPLEDPVYPLPIPTVPVSDHRREHRPGKPPIIPTDPVLQAFITARLDRMTFAEIAADVAANFPKERRVGKSAIHAWWQSTRKPTNRKPGRLPDHSG